MSEADIAAVMAQAMGSEDRRRELASQRPGLGSLLPMEQPAAAAAVGKSSVDMPVIGEGYEMTAPDAVQHKAYGSDQPVYADDLVSGYGFQGGRQEPAVRVWYGSRRAADGITLVSPGTRPGLWSRFLGKLRRG
jgi:hypothetical protein